MTDMNSVFLIGRTTREISDTDFSYTQNGTARLFLSIAVNRSEKNGNGYSDRASFFDVTVWGKTAETLKQYITKGKQIAVHGYLDQQRWEKDGKKFSKVCVIAASVQLLGGVGQNQNMQNQQQYSAPPQYQQPQPQYQPQQQYQQDVNGYEFTEDVPF